MNCLTNYREYLHTYEENWLNPQPASGFDTGFAPKEQKGYYVLELTPEQAAYLTPDRATLGTVWRYLSSAAQPVQTDSVCLCRKIVRWSGQSLDTAQLLVCLDIFADVGLLQLDKHHNDITVRLSSQEGKADLNQSQTMQRLLLAKES